MDHCGDSAQGTDVEPELRAELTSLYQEGRQISEHFNASVRQYTWHPFVAANYETVERCLLSLRQPGLRFLEWGSATGIVTIMAALLGFDACGIEFDRNLVAIARRVARRRGSTARFAVGSFIPAGYQWRSSTGDPRLGTLGQGMPGYRDLRLQLSDFDIVFAYPWSGEEPIMHDIMLRHARPGARLLVNRTEGVTVHQVNPGHSTESSRDRTGACTSSTKGWAARESDDG